MLIIHGERALSPFRLGKIAQELSCNSDDLAANFIYFVETAVDQALSEPELAVLHGLLGAPESVQQGVGRSNGANADVNVVYTVPRFGTISPWASKATDIAHNCGLAKVMRIERGIQWQFADDIALLAETNGAARWSRCEDVIYDPMIEVLIEQAQDAAALFKVTAPQSVATVDVLNLGMAALTQANETLGLALTEVEMAYLKTQFEQLERNPTDVELMMFSQVNSEHCRHKIFNASWTIDGDDQPMSLFGMIRETHAANPQGTIVAYSDNAAVLAGNPGSKLLVDVESKRYGMHKENLAFTAKVETHNHPTAVSPFPGAATGAGGEIRDEGATGRGGKPKAGLVGYSVSNLRLPDAPQPWEDGEARSSRLASPRDIMLQAPIGAAAFNNEFGRPNILGYFRSFEQHVEHHDAKGAATAAHMGYHKPIMLAGGLGTVREQHVSKLPIKPGNVIIVLGGPTMLIGLGGGAASSVASGESSEALDFASVQRGNPELQRRCQEVIDACCAMGAGNPIVSIHDVGAGGVSNALPELVHDAGCGGRFELRNMHNDEPGMSPLQIWCNESQERYVLAVAQQRLPEFEALCERERCLYAVVGEATEANDLALHDDYFASQSQPSREQTMPIDLPMETLFGLPPKMHRDVRSAVHEFAAIDYQGITLDDALKRVISHPTVGDKRFLITIGDRSVTGLIHRDQMVGPWQVAVADVAVTLSDYQGKMGEAMAIGERTPLAMVDAPASARMAIGEMVTNLAAAPVNQLSRVKVSANWMVAAGADGQDAQLYATVKSVALEVCPALGLAIPVGKDSMSMQSRWQDEQGEARTVTSPLSLVVSAFAPLPDVSRTLTPELRTDLGESDIWLLDLGQGQDRMGAGIFAQVYQQVGDKVPDLDDPELLKCFFDLIQNLNVAEKILAYHDRSDGGVIASLLEMAFCSRCGLDIDVPDALAAVADGDQTVAALNWLFNEELGAVIQTRREQRQTIIDMAEDFGLGACLQSIASVRDDNRIVISCGTDLLFHESRHILHRAWSTTSWQMQRTRDNPQCADAEYALLNDMDDPGLSVNLSFDPDLNPVSAMLNVSSKPKVAILREQGVNGHHEMAAAFLAAGFECVDVTMTDLHAGADLSAYHGLAVCGGFSYGDVLGAGQGWAKSVRYNPQVKQAFEDFFQRRNTFTLGVCNGCQMLSELADLIPGADHWPRFRRNVSEQYEARLVLTKIVSERSILLRGMAGSVLPVAVAHGEGLAVLNSAVQGEGGASSQANSLGAVMQFVDNYHQPTEQYPLNPNGSPAGATGFTSNDGRATIMMPHPERITRTLSHSWHPNEWDEFGPWQRLFYNARAWLD